MAKRWAVLALGGVIAMAGIDAPKAEQTSAVNEMLAAAARGDTAAIRQLIATSAPLDPVDGGGRTPLLIAVEKDHGDAALLLIEAGADINAQAANKDSPWLQAGALGRTEMLRAMIPRKPDLSLRNRYGGNALIPACERAHVDTVKLLLTTGIDVNHVNDLGWTCLLEVVILGDGGPRHVEVAKLVLAAGADPNLADKDGVSPLMHARQKGQDEVAKLIEEAGGR
jgi:ankyrin repeat protein